MVHLQLPWFQCFPQKHLFSKDPIPKLDLVPIAKNPKLDQILLWFLLTKTKINGSNKLN